MHRRAHVPRGSWDRIEENAKDGGTGYGYEESRAIILVHRRLLWLRNSVVFAS